MAIEGGVLVNWGWGEDGWTARWRQGLFLERAGVSELTIIESVVGLTVAKLNHWRCFDTQLQSADRRTGLLSSDNTTLLWCGVWPDSIGPRWNNIYDAAHDLYLELDRYLMLSSIRNYLQKYMERVEWTLDKDLELQLLQLSPDNRSLQSYL